MLMKKCEVLKITQQKIFEFLKYQDGYHWMIAANVWSQIG